MTFAERRAAIVAHREAAAAARERRDWGAAVGELEAAERLLDEYLSEQSSAALVTALTVALAAIATIAIEVLGRPRTRTRTKKRPGHLKLVAPRKGRK